MRSRKLLALIFSLLAIAPALAGYMTLLGAGVGSIAPIAPVVSWVSGTDAFPSSSLTFSRTSNATMFDSTGKLTYAPNNLLKQSNTFSNAAWTKQEVTLGGTTSGPNGLTGTLVIPSTTVGATHSLQQSITTASNVILWAIAKGDGTYNAASISDTPDNYVHFDLTNGSVSTIGTGFTGAGAQSLGSGWYLIYAYRQASSTIGTARFYILNSFIASGNTNPPFNADGVHGVYFAQTGVSAVTYETTPRTADQVITTSAAYYGPRIDYDPNTLAVKGLLIEEARTNLYLNSSNLTTGSTTASAAARSTDGTLGPDGVSLMTKLLATVGAGAHELYNNPALSVSSGSVYTASIFVKKGNYRYVFVTGEIASNGGFCAVFDLDNPSTSTQSWSTGGSASIIGSKIESVGGGIYRIQASGAIGSGTTGYLVAGFAGAATGNSTASVEPSWTAAGTEYGYFFGAQLELGSFATSYIPTAAASVTRAADVVQFTGAAAVAALQAASGSAIVQMADVYANTAAGAVAVLGGNGSTAYPLGLFNAAARTYNGSTALNAANAMTLTSPFRVGLAWGASSRSLVGNGGTVATDAGGNWSGQTAYYLGSYGGASLFPNGHVASFGIYNQRLPDATLQSKSIVGASYAANDNGLRFANNDNLPIHWRVAL